MRALLGIPFIAFGLLLLWLGSTICGSGFTKTLDEQFARARRPRLPTQAKNA